jgi:hypothetical protein
VLEEPEVVDVALRVRGHGDRMPHTLCAQGAGRGKSNVERWDGNPRPISRGHVNRALSSRWPNGELGQSVGSPITRSSERVRGTLDVSGNELIPALRSVALALEESTRMLVRITDLHDEAAGMQGQLAEALADLERILARLEENDPRTDL